MEKQSSFPIKRKDVEEYYKKAGDLLSVVSYTPTQEARRSSSSDKNYDENILELRRLATGKTAQRSQDVKITRLFKQYREDLTPGLLTMTAQQNMTFEVLQKAVALALYMKDAYAKAAGLETLSQMRDETNLDASQQEQFAAKQQTATAVMLFTLAYYIEYRLTGELPDSMDTMRNKFGGIPEVNMSRPTKGLSSVLFYYGTYLENPELINSVDDLMAFTLLYFEAVREEIMIRKDSLNYTEWFDDRTYKLEGSDFAINGFHAELSSNVVSVEFNKVQFEEIVGNREAKHRALRIIAMMLSFDFEAKKNPFNEFGGFPTISMGYGKPGTGKSMLIAATATRLKERCDWLGYPFLFWPFPDNIVSTYQGGSAERAMDWFQPLRDTSKIIYAPIDDAENVLQDRAQRGVSAGVKEVIGVMLRQTEGAYAVNHGNYTIGLYTNLPEQIDPAVLSRIQYRAPIDGAVNKHDFVDQTHLWLREYKELDEHFLSLGREDSYELLSAQKEVASLSSLSGESTDQQITQETVREIYERAANEYDVNSYEFFGAFYTYMQDHYEGFTSREVRNIHKTVSSRIMDFDLPDRFWDDPSVYFHQPYDEKVGIITDLVKENMQSLQLGEIMLEEALKYADNYARIADTAMERKIEKRAEEIQINIAAQQRLAQKDDHGPICSYRECGLHAPTQKSRNMERLKEAGLYGAELVPIRRPVVGRYNRCLDSLGFTPTTLDKFAIDALGWSPQIAEEKESSYYLAHGELNPYGIIVSPEQAGKPVYFPYHSFDRSMMDYVFATYDAQIKEITKERAIGVEIDQNIHAFQDPLDLLEYHHITIGFYIQGDEATHKRQQLDLVAKFRQGDNYLDRDLQREILGSARKYGNLTQKTVDLDPLVFNVDSFHTRAFGGVFVLRDDPKPTILVVEEKPTFTQLENSSEAEVFYIHDPALLDYLQEHDWIAMSSEYYQHEPARLRRTGHMILAITFAEEAIDDPIGEVLERSPLLRKYLNEHTEHERIRTYWQLQAVVESIENSEPVDVTSATLEQALYHPASHLAEETTSLIWKLLGKVSKLDPFYLYKHDKNEFYETYQQWPEAVRDWVKMTVLKHNS